MMLDGREINVLDLPGSYSLAASSPDERISSDVLSGRGEDVPDLTICVVDSRQLARSLQLACQIADLGVPLIIALNFMDEVIASGQSVNAVLLSQRLGVPVIPISARKGEGLEGSIGRLESAWKPRSSCELRNGRSACRLRRWS